MPWPVRGLVVAAPSGFARLVAAVGTVDETEAPDNGAVRSHFHRDRRRNSGAARSFTLSMR
ncbi:hypothetical protein [Nostoc sp.]|uniref:hypothetical protein n=1 Tax=Nostoc sp. TaxID=1180 RepID=UPI002FFC2380